MYKVKTFADLVKYMEMALSLEKEMMHSTEKDSIPQEVEYSYRVHTILVWFQRYHTSPLQFGVYYYGLPEKSAFMKFSQMNRNQIRVAVQGEDGLRKNDSIQHFNSVDFQMTDNIEKLLEVFPNRTFLNSIVEELTSTFKENIKRLRNYFHECLVEQVTEILKIWRISNSSFFEVLEKEYFLSCDSVRQSFWRKKFPEELLEKEKFIKTMEMVFESHSTITSNQKIPIEEYLHEPLSILEQLNQLEKWRLGKNPVIKLKDDYKQQSAKIIRDFMQGIWPQNIRSGLSPQDCETLKAALNSLFPSLEKIRPE